ncbi:MAG: acyl-CoA dehydrogenase family protein [Leucobacter sp.]
MTIFDVSPDERELTHAVEKVCAEILAPRAATVDESEEIPHTQLDYLSEMGVFGLGIPESHGGAGVSSIAMSEMVAAIAGACTSTASIVTAHYLAVDSILIGGDDAQHRRLLPTAADGSTLGAFGLTEPGAGSNPAEMSTKAVRTADGWHLTGTKHFISNAGFADVIVVFAVTDEEAGHHGISAFAVEPAQVAGVTIGSEERTMGLRGSPVYEINFDCVLPPEALLGAEGSGFKTAMRVLDRGRIEVAAMSLGVSRAAMNESIEWAASRKIGGRPISHLQGIAFKLADMHARYRSALLVTAEAAHSRDTGHDFTIRSATAKLVASEAAAFITDEAIQVHGGYGYTRSLALERYARDVRIFRIYEGSSEIQRMIISRALTQPAR